MLRKVDACWGAEIFPSNWWWTNRQSRHKGCENTFAVPLVAKQNKK
jgi:hypothetical protein